MTDAEQFYHLIRKKHEFLQKLHECSTNQLRYVGESDMNALMELLAVKQRLLLEIEGLDLQLKPYHVDDPEQRVWPNPEMREQCRATVAESNELVLRTLDLDKQAERQLIVKKGDAKLQLRQFDSKARVQLAYQQQQNPATPEQHPRANLEG